MRLITAVKKILRHLTLWRLLWFVFLAFLYSSIYWTSFSNSLLNYRSHQESPLLKLPANSKIDYDSTYKYMQEKRTVVKSDLRNVVMIVAKNFRVGVKEESALNIKTKLPISAELDKLIFDEKDNTPAKGDLAIIKENLDEAVKSWFFMLTVKIVNIDDGNGKQTKMVVDSGQLVPYDKTDKILRWSKEIEVTAQKYHLDPAVIAAIIEQESAGNPSAGSPAGAQGLMQLMPGTARGLGVNPWDPLQNIDGGTRYFLYQYKRFGNLEQALAAYNAGPGNVINGNYLYYSETQRYIRNVPLLIAKYQQIFATANNKKKTKV